ncbi:MAG TPA: sugar ABC transporter substrate-binding protein [Trueperaceae bacterium]|nr:sugar ABC transporter substrate-binding protein [Trueperaceae bacterium]
MIPLRNRTFALVLLVAGMLAAQGATAQNQPVTLTFANWADAEQATRPGIEAVIQQFEQQNPDIKIKSEAISFNDIGHTLVLRVKSGNPPDVAEIAGNPTFQLAATGGLQPLDSYLTPTIQSQVNPADLAIGKYQGKLVAFPWTDSPTALWYNKKLMKAAGLDPNKPPQTIDELTQDLAAIHKSNPNVIPLGLDTTNRSFGLSVNWPWMVAFGAKPFSGNTANADTPEMKAYLSWMRELAQKGYIETGKKIGEFRPLAAHGSVAFIWDQNVLQGVIQSVNGMSDQAFNDTWGVEPQPKGPAGESHVVAEGHQLVMFAKSQHKEAAWKFIQFLATSSYAIKNYTFKYESSLPPLAHASGDIQTLLNTPVNQAFVNDIMPTVIIPPYGETYGLAYSPIMAGVQEAVTGNTPIDQIAASIQSNLKNALQ